MLLFMQSVGVAASRIGTKVSPLFNVKISRDCRELLNAVNVLGAIVIVEDVVLFDRIIEGPKLLLLLLFLNKLRFKFFMSDINVDEEKKRR